MTSEQWTIREVAEHFGVSESRARAILAEAGVTSGYDADAVRAIQRAGQGRRTDLQQRGLSIIIRQWEALSGWARIDSRRVEPGDTVDLRGVAAEWLIGGQRWATGEVETPSTTIHTPVRVELGRLHETFDWVETYARCAACTPDHAPVLDGPTSYGPGRTMDPAQALADEEMAAARGRLGLPVRPDYRNDRLIDLTEDVDGRWTWTFERVELGDTILYRTDRDKRGSFSRLPYDAAWRMTTPTGSLTWPTERAAMIRDICRRFGADNGLAENAPKETRHVHGH